MMADSLVIDVRSLTKSYQGKQAISGLTMQLAEGGMIGLVGANGGGKTTTLKMLAGLLSPDAGEGQVLGADIRRCAPDRRRIGYMSQRTTLDPELTVREAIAFHAGMFGIGKQQGDWIEVYGLGPVIDKRVASLSGGWARRAHFAITLLHQPALLLLDEPTAGIDALTRATIWGWLHQLAGQGTAIVISTHDLAEAQRCPQIILYDEGLAEGPMDPASLIGASGAQTLEQAVLARGAS